MAEGDRLVVEDGLGGLAGLLVGLAIAPRGALAALGRVGRLHLRRPFAAVVALDLDLVPLGQEVGLLAEGVAAGREAVLLGRAGRLLGLLALDELVPLL